MGVRVFVSMSLLIVLVGCAKNPRATEVARPEGSLNAPAPRPAAPGVISHIVFFKLIDPSESDELIVDCDTKLATIPGVVSYACGTHLDTGRGERVNADYDVALYLGFDSRRALDAYVAHPNHTAIVSAWQPRLQWIRVQDVIDQTP